MAIDESSFSSLLAAAYVPGAGACFEGEDNPPLDRALSPGEREVLSRIDEFTAGARSVIETFPDCFGPEHEVYEEELERLFGRALTLYDDALWLLPAHSSELTRRWSALFTELTFAEMALASLDLCPVESENGVNDDEEEIFCSHENEEQNGDWWMRAKAIPTPAPTVVALRPPPVRIGGLGGASFGTGELTFSSRAAHAFESLVARHNQTATELAQSLRGLEAPNGSAARAAAVSFLETILTRMGGSMYAGLAGGAYRVDLARIGSVSVVVVVVRDETWVRTGLSQRSGGFSSCHRPLIVLPEQNSGRSGVVYAHELHHQLTRLILEATFGPLDWSRYQVTANTARTVTSRRLLDEFVSLTTQRLSGQTWTSLAQILIQFGYAEMALSTLPPNFAAAIQGTDSRDTLNRLVERTARTLELFETVQGRLGLPAERMELFIRRVLRAHPNLHSFLGAWGDLSVHELERFARRVPAHRWHQYTTAAAVRTVLDRSATADFFCRPRDAGPVVRAGPLVLLRFYLAQGFTRDQFHDLLGSETIPFSGLTLRRIFGGLIPARWGLVRPQDMGTVGTFVTITGQVAGDVAIFHAVDRLFSLPTAAVLRRLGATRVAALLGRRGVMSIAGPAFAFYAGWNAFEAVGMTDFSRLSDAQIFGASLYSTTFGAYAGGPTGGLVLAGGAFIGAAGGGVLAGAAILGRAFWELHQTHRRGDMQAERMGVHLTMLRARLGLIRGDDAGPDNPIIAAAQEYLDDIGGRVMLGAMTAHGSIPADAAISIPDTRRAYQLFVLYETLSAERNPAYSDSELERRINSLLRQNTTALVSGGVWQQWRSAFRFGKEAREQFERIYKRGVLISARNTSDRIVVTHAVADIHAEFTAFTRERARSRDEKLEWIQTRLPLVNDIVASEELMGYLFSQAPEIYVFLEREVAPAIEAEEAARRRVRTELLSEEVRTRLGPTLWGVWVRALNYEIDLSDTQLRYIMNVLDGAALSPEEEQSRRQQAADAFLEERSDHFQSWQQCLSLLEPATRSSAAVFTAVGSVDGHRSFAVRTEHGVLFFRRDGDTLKVRLFRTLALPAPLPGEDSSSLPSTLFWSREELEQIAQRLVSELEVGAEVDADTFFATRGGPSALNALLRNAEHFGSADEQLFFFLSSYRHRRPVAEEMTRFRAVWNGFWVNPHYAGGVPDGARSFSAFLSRLRAGLAAREAERKAQGGDLDESDFSRVAFELEQHAATRFGSAQP